MKKLQTGSVSCQIADVCLTRAAGRLRMLLVHNGSVRAGEVSQHHAAETDRGSRGTYIDDASCLPGSGLVCILLVNISIIVGNDASCHGPC